VVRLLTSRLAWACLALGAVMTSACSSSTPTQPTPPIPPDPLRLTCPDAVSLPSPTALPIAIRYGTATATGGVPPVRIVCTPSNDSMFPVGATTVTCNATDTRGTTASCTFGVTVTPPPRISLTEFLAFGDSITAGEITVAGESIGQHVLQVIPSLSYPTDLGQSLAARYSAQPVSVANSGAKGENTFDGLARLPPLLAATQALLIVEGANDINNASDAQVLAALNNIRSMVRLAKGRNVKVYVGSLPPENPFTCVTPCRTGGYAQLQNYNNGLRTIAAAESVPFVDVFAAFHGDTTTLIGPDGLHPTAQGYVVMANAFFDAIKTTLEVPATATQTPLSLPKLPFVAAPPRRR